MKINCVRKAIMGAALAGSLALGGCGMSGHDMGSMSGAASPGAATTSTGPHNDADVMFATMMIPHHQQAVEMSDLILTKQGVDPEITALATKIKNEQAPEITRMSGWLGAWGTDPSPSGMDGMDHHSGGGMMSHADLDALAAADGAAAGPLFLTGMVAHHEGAVAMARTELADGQNTDATALARSVVTSQQAEITEMKTLLASS